MTVAGIFLAYEWLVVERFYCCSDYEPGVGVWGTGRLAGAGRAAVQRGAGRMCPDAGGHADYPGRCYPAQELKWALVFWIYTGFAAGSVDFMF